MDPYDQALLEHTMRWCNYGGGEELIFPEFGLTPEMFYRRVLTVVDSRSELEFPAKQYLRAYCTEKVTSAARRRRTHPFGL